MSGRAPSDPGARPVSSATPPHYTAFRMVLVAVVALVLGAAVWAAADPPVLASLLSFLELGRLPPT